MLIIIASYQLSPLESKRDNQYNKQNDNKHDPKCVNYLN